MPVFALRIISLPLSDDAAGEFPALTKFAHE